MAIYTSNRDGGKTDQAGHLRAATKMLVGEVIDKLQIKANDPLGMSVLVATGTGLIPSGTGYSFPFWLDADEEITIATASGANDRIDLVVAYVDLDETPSTGVSNNSNDIVKIEAVAGTPAAVPVAPDTSTIQAAIGAANPFIILGEVLVAQSTTTINAGALTDRRTMAGAKEMPGVTKEYAGSNLPAGYLWCAGQEVDRDVYSDLFYAIGTTHGVGDGSTTFNLPDHRGRAVAGKDNMDGSSANRLTDQSGGVNGDVLGDAGGEEQHTLALADVPNRTGTLILHGSENGSIFASASGVFSTSSGVTGKYSNSNPQSGSTSRTNIKYNHGGGGGAHNNVQPTLIANKIIAF